MSYTIMLSKITTRIQKFEKEWYRTLWDLQDFNPPANRWRRPFGNLQNQDGRVKRDPY
jgi:CRISPR/Cas system CMR-associated protein Cmr1 (group 7 of RAMP superfamily)